MSSSKDLTSAQWTKSSYSNGDGGSCVEWAPEYAATSGAVPVRDSKDPAGPALLLRSAAFSAFVRAVRAGELGGGAW
ncbi:DUF397 domain-containing protein [Streptomyces sp. NBC_01317]|uniref:DUF397 domain-containing protein n=1 Tax=Streptomyces sp. NBC_01317 TaxID=2903822 RepID=UPI002E0FD754|nr:DUF397 domain-containing protein [Streptomyces sp. NBC_01317]